MTSTFKHLQAMSYLPDEESMKDDQRNIMVSFCELSDGPPIGSTFWNILNMIMCIVGGCPCCTVWNDVHTSLRSLKPEMNNSEKLSWALVVTTGFYRFFSRKRHKK